MKYFRLFAYLVLLVAIENCASPKIITLTESNIELLNREYAASHDANSGIISIQHAEGGGSAIIKSVEFETGTIEFDVRGENNPGKSFVGLSINIQDIDTYECVYFRPFNFLSEDQTRRSHSIQYIYNPAHPWSLLREQHKGVFETEYIDPPNPDDWFTVHIEILPTKVIVRDPNSKEILLEVKRIGEIKSNKIGFWTGHNSKGDFRNLRVMKEQ